MCISQLRFLYMKLYVAKLSPALDPTPAPPGGKRGGGPLKINESGREWGGELKILVKRGGGGAGS